MNPEEKLKILLKHGSTRQQIKVFTELEEKAIETGDLEILNILKEAETITPIKLRSTTIDTITEGKLQSVRFNSNNSSQILLDLIKNPHIKDKEAILLFPLYEAINIANQALKNDYVDSSKYENMDKFKEIVTLSYILKTASITNPYHFKVGKTFPHELKLAAGMRFLIDRITKLEDDEYINNNLKLE